MHLPAWRLSEQEMWCPLRLTANRASSSSAWGLPGSEAVGPWSGWTGWYFSWAAANELPEHRCSGTLRSAWEVSASLDGAYS
jgi:hypothetical protein